MRIEAVSIFPDYFSPLSLSLVGKAVAKGIIDVEIHDLRQWTHDRHRTVDDTPYGGGAGMVMKPEPWGECFDELFPPETSASNTVESAIDQVSDQARDVEHPTNHVEPDLADSQTCIIFPTPSGIPFNQRLAHELATKQRLVFGCGRYEGIDHRVFEFAATKAPVLEVSLGDYVLNGGEVAVLAMIEAVVRLIPGVIGNPDSLVEESHSESQAGLLEYPVYTKPEQWRGYSVPEVLLSGHHGKVQQWRNQQALDRTSRVRPDLIPQQDSPSSR